MKKIFVILILTFLLMSFPRSSFAQTYSDEDNLTDEVENQVEADPIGDCLVKNCPTLVEQFNKKKLKTKIWEVFDNGGTLSFDKQFVTLTAGSAMPYVVTRENLFPSSGPFTIEFGIQYLTAGDGGGGVGISFSKPPNVTDSDFWANTPLAFWQDSTSLKIASYGNLLRISSGPSYIYHVVKFSYDGASYRVTLNGFTFPFIFTAPPTTSLWFGHPGYCCPSSWSSFKLDYLKVASN